MEGDSSLISERAYKKKYEYLFDKFATGILVVNQLGIIEEINLYACNQFGFERDQLVNQPISTIYKYLHLSKEELFSMKLQLFNLERYQSTIALVNVRQEKVYLHATIDFMNEEQKFFVQLGDCTETVFMQKQLAQAEALTNLGELAASIAHEIRNPMTSLKGFTQLMQTEASERSTKYLQVIEQEIDRIDKILNEFLELSKPKTRVREECNVQEIVDDILNFMAPQALLYGVQLQLVYRSKIHFLYMDSIIMKQILINTIKNAIEAMQDGGTIRIVVDSHDGEIEISIHDEGTGLDLEHLNRYFEAFYTTKETGTGLGLAHASRVMEDLRGRIEVANNLAGGASFYYFFPTTVYV